MNNNIYDVVIIGSGFSGSLCATILASRGLRVAIVDRGQHPKFAIGESSTPIANMILRDLGQKYGISHLDSIYTYGRVRENHPSISIGKKRGFTYFNHSTDIPFAPGIDHENELYVAASNSDQMSDTHWFRSDMDSFLVEKAVEAGATLYDNSEPQSIDWIQDNWEMTTIHAATSRTIKSEFLLDASGSGRVLERALKLPRSDYNFETNTAASFSHFSACKEVDLSFYSDNKQRSDLPYVPDDSAVHHILDHSSWMWMLRFSNGITSAGLLRDLQKNESNSAPNFFRRIEKYPSLKRVFRDAKIAATPGKLIETGRLQRTASMASGKAWAMLPHTFGFVDPLHSTGIAWSLLGVESLMDILLSSSNKPDRGKRLQGYSKKLMAELKFVDLLCSLCYKTMNDFEKFTASCMLYFAASISFEKTLKKRNGGSEISEEEHVFLHAGSKDLLEIVTAAHQQCEDPNYSSWLENQIAPFNDVGLFKPAINNIYLHTVADL